MVGGQKTIFHWVPDHYQNMVVFRSVSVFTMWRGSVLVGYWFFKDSFWDHAGYQYQY
jgi:hypothetical protein